MSSCEHVQRLDRIDEAKALELLVAIRPADWTRGTVTRFHAPIEGMYILHRDGRTGESTDEALLWPELAGPALELAEEARGSISGKLDQLIIYRIPAGVRLAEHVDRWVRRGTVRVHIPLQTDPRAYFVAGGVRHHLAFGWAWTVDNHVPHSVENGSGFDRIHLIADWYDE